MLATGAISILPKLERPIVVIPLGVVPKGTERKFRLIINTRYVNQNLVKKKFKFEGLKGMGNLAEKGDHAVSIDLTAMYYHVLEPTMGLSGRAVITFIITFPLG